MACKGFCESYRAKKPYRAGRYAAGQKRCNVCQIFLNWKGLMCPCCGCKLRGRPRDRNLRVKLTNNWCMK